MAELDFNLIRTFVAVYETGSVSAAAQRLHVTQPSVSHALARLRDALRRPLFTRARHGMEPTALAGELYPELKGALIRMEAAISSVLDFDPGRSRRTFKVAMTDLGQIAFLPSIMKALAEVAPTVGLEVISFEIDTATEWLLKGTIDAAICPALPSDRRIGCERIFEERYQCIYRAGHPRMRGDPTLDEYLAEAHIALSNSIGHRSIERAWSAVGIAPKVVLRLPNPGVLENIVAETDFLTTVPSHIAALFARQSRIRSAELPFVVPPFDVGIHWRDHGQDAQDMMWFRCILAAALGPGRPI